MIGSPFFMRSHTDAPLRPAVCGERANVGPSLLTFTLSRNGTAFANMQIRAIAPTVSDDPTVFTQAMPQSTCCDESILIVAVPRLYRAWNAPLRHCACLGKLVPSLSVRPSQARCPSIRASQISCVCRTSRPFGGMGPLGPCPRHGSRRASGLPPVVLLQKPQSAREQSRADKEPRTKTRG